MASVPSLSSKVIAEFADKFKEVLHPVQSQAQPPAMIAGAYKLFAAHVSKTDPSENVFMSPLSVQLALGLALLGATPGSLAQRELCAAVFAAPSDAAGVIVRELRDTLRSFQQTSSTLELANALFVKGKVIRDTYVRDCHNTLQAVAHPLPPVVTPINDWCAAATHGKITHLLDSFDPDTVAVLLNAVYFKGAWKSAFAAESTVPGTFTTANGAAKPCQMMRKLESMACLDTPLFSACRLPYGKDEEFGAWFVLPKTSAENSATELALRAEEVFGMLQTPGYGKVRLTCPRFKLECGPLSLVGTLRSLGCKAVLEGEYMPDGRHGFDGMVPKDGDLVYIQDVIHKAVCEVNEEGTVAAAATAVVMTKRRSAVRSDPPLKITLDREFLFAIVHKASNKPLFLGRVSDPTLE